MSVCLCVCFKLSRADLSHQGANHHDHSGGIMILGGPWGSRGCPAQGRRGPLRAPGVLRRARSMILQAPPGRRRHSVTSVCLCHATSRHAWMRRRHDTARHCMRCCKFHARRAAGDDTSLQLAASYAERASPNGPSVRPSVAMMLVRPSPWRSGFTMRNTTCEYRPRTRR